MTIFSGDLFAEGIDAFIVSISVIIGIIVGVIVLVVLSAVIIVCCCCKHRDFTTRRQKSVTSGYRSGMTEVPVIEPSGECSISVQQTNSKFMKVFTLQF